MYFCSAHVALKAYLTVSLAELSIVLGFSLVSYKADVRETKKCMVNLRAYMNCPPAMNMQRNGVFDERI